MIMEKRVMIRQDALDSFTEILDDIHFSIVIELAKKDSNKKVIRELLDELKIYWSGIYNSADIQVSRSLRKLYSCYVKAKQSGDMEAAALYLDCYLSVKNRQNNHEDF